ncbi:hypothetical protein MACK_003861 [Theileria orientalis]|uniref:Uncharacterized protein n=1 Tax=Theileria orientalis TaxID=68886 RepID=A0A976SIZ0_THEOR|nr:hypothetical protein MACK_003861 [Theileria orientalis]
MKDKKNDTENNFILRVYNVPPYFTVSKLQEVIEENCATVHINKIIPPSEWDDVVDTCWIILCKDRKTHSALLDLKDIWFKPDKNDKYGVAITFVAGEKLDLTFIPSKVDEQLLLNEHLNSTDI